MPRSSTLYHPVQEPLLLAHGRCCLSVWLAVASVWAGSLPQLHLCDHCRSLCWMGGTTLCLACKVDGVGGLTSGSVLFYHTAPGLDTHREEGALGAGSCWHLPRWAEMELRKLGGSPSTKQQNLALLRGPVGCLPAVHAGESLGSALPARRWNVPSSKSSQPVGLGRARGSLSSTCPSGTPPTAQGLAKCSLCFCLGGPVLPRQLGSQSPRCSTCAQYPATLISRAPHPVGLCSRAALQSWAFGGPGPLPTLLHSSLPRLWAGVVVGLGARWIAALPLCPFL